MMSDSAESLRTIDLAGLHRLGKGVWRVGEDALLRTLRSGRPITTLESARGVFESYRISSDAGVRMPRPLEIVYVEGGYGVIVEYVQGVSLGALLFLRVCPYEKAGSGMAELARELHSHHVDEGRDWHRRFSDYVRAVSGRAPQELAQRLEAFFESIPKTDALLHGDLHPANIVVCDGEFALIDMEASGFGDPMFDLAIMRSRLFFDHLSKDGSEMPDEDRLQAAKAIWRAVLEGYFDGADDAELEMIDTKLEILSEVENTALRSNLIRPIGRELSIEQQTRLEICLRRLEELLPRLSGA